MGSTTCKKCGHKNNVRNIGTLDHYNCSGCDSRQNLKFVHTPGQEKASNPFGL